MIVAVIVMVVVVVTLPAPVLETCARGSNVRGNESSDPVQVWGDPHVHTQAAAGGETPPHAEAHHTYHRVLAGHASLYIYRRQGAPTVTL